MGRPLRHHVPGASYHIILRGNDRQRIFFRDRDRLRFLDLIAEGKSRYGHKIFAFCLMNNHVHLALQVGSISLARILQNLVGRYASEIHRRLGRKGHLFQNRYRCFHVETDSYFLELVRYIHLNPVRANLVADPSAYRWSGHRAVLGQSVLPWLSTRGLLARFSPSPWRGRLLYESFIRDGLQGNSGDEPLLLQEKGWELPLQAPSPSKPVITTQTAPPLDRIFRAVCQEFDLSESRLRGLRPEPHRIPARAWVGLLARETRAASLTEVAKRAARDPSNVSRAVCRLEMELTDCESARQRLERLLRAIVGE